MMNETLNLRSNSFISFTMQHNIHNLKAVSVHTMVTKIYEPLFTENSIQCKNLRCQKKSRVSSTLCGLTGQGVTARSSTRKEHN